MSFLKANISENYEFAKQKLRIARYAKDTLDNYELRGIPVDEIVRCCNVMV